MKILNKASTMIVIGVLLFTGCDSMSVDALKEDPPHLITEETLLTSYDGFQAALNGLYGLVREERASAGNSSCGPCSSSNALRIGWAIGGTDIFATNSRHSGPPSSLNADFGNLVNPHDAYISDMFFWLYRIVNTANTIIDQAENGDEVNWSAGPGSAEENRTIVIAESMAIRAWAYRHLTNHWGDVPLNLNPSSGSTIKTDWTRTPIEEVRDQIIIDLEFAEEHIPVERSFEARITKGAIQHYLSEMHLFMNDSETALMWADLVIDTPEYQLITERYGVRANQPGVPFMDMFLEGNQNRSQGNTEALWVFQYGLNVVGGGRIHMRQHFGIRYAAMTVGDTSPLVNTAERGGRSSSRSSLTNFALNLWDEDDDRGSEHAIRWFYILKDAAENAPYGADNLPQGFAFGDTIWTDISQNITPDNHTDLRRPFIRKVDAGVDPNDITSSHGWGNWVYLRLGHTYMLKAEAQFRLGDLAGAAETINILRRRSNTSEITAADVDIDFILDERARELAVEAERKITLIRTGKYLERTRAHNFRGGQFVEERHKLLPIPQDVIDSNLDSNFPQNSGY